MVDFNLDEVNRITFIAPSNMDIKQIAIEGEKSIDASRCADKLLHSLGMLSDCRYFAKELAYSRTESIFLKLRHGASRPLSRIP